MKAKAPSVLLLAGLLFGGAALAVIEDENLGRHANNSGAVQQTADYTHRPTVAAHAGYER